MFFAAPARLLWRRWTTVIESCRRWMLASRLVNTNHERLHKVGPAAAAAAAAQAATSTATSLYKTGTHNGVYKVRATSLGRQNRAVMAGGSCTHCSLSSTKLHALTTLTAEHSRPTNNLRHATQRNNRATTKPQLSCERVILPTCTRY